MDGVGGASEEITWQRYNGVRRSRFIPDQERERAPEPQMDNRKFIGTRPKTDKMWTEITKDLVVKDALEGSGYEYEETEYFFYVMEYLRYVCLSFPFSQSSNLYNFSQYFYLLTLITGRCLPSRSYLRRHPSQASGSYPPT